ncbi:kinetochore-associated protein Mtw1p [Diutina catenulata]
MDGPYQDLLVEHLGFTPLSFVDDVINAVNEIASKCIDSLDKFLHQQHEAYGETVFPLLEIKVGVAKLQTLLESQLDHYFDKFELYMFRNIFAVPTQLAPAVNWGKLLDVETSAPPNLDQSIKQLADDIANELALKKLLTAEIVRARVIVEQTTKLSQAATSATKDGNSDYLKSLSPLGSTVLYVTNQVLQLAHSTLELSAEVKVTKPRHVPSVSRQDYLNNRTKHLASVHGLEHDSRASPGQYP